MRATGATWGAYTYATVGLVLQVDSTIALLTPAFNAGVNVWRLAACCWRLRQAAFTAPWGACIVCRGCLVAHPKPYDSLGFAAGLIGVSGLSGLDAHKLPVAGCAGPKCRRLGTGLPCSGLCSVQGRLRWLTHVVTLRSLMDAGACRFCVCLHTSKCIVVAASTRAATRQQWQRVCWLLQVNRSKSG